MLKKQEKSSVSTSLSSSVLSPFIWWLGFSSLWGVYRLFTFPELFSEVVAKPVVWLGSIVLIWYMGYLPRVIVTELRFSYLRIQPFLLCIVLPMIFTGCYFWSTNWRIISIPAFSASVLLYTVVVNFMTGIVEEITYRGILYVWLKKVLGLEVAFVVTQILFLLGHIPILVLHSDSIGSALSHAFFIVLMSTIYTVIFESTKSLYASSLSHGLWNSMVYYLLLR